MCVRPLVLCTNVPVPGGSRVPVVLCPVWIPCSSVIFDIFLAIQIEATYYSPKRTELQGHLKNELCQLTHTRLCDAARQPLIFGGFRRRRWLRPPLCVAVHKRVPSQPQIPPAPGASSTLGSHGDPNPAAAHPCVPVPRRAGERCSRSRKITH